ncbi:MAG: hypothetical protein EXR69_04665 [Myxococcales bacterium]|nr:hypothetical protein [Myxococcales bacterium]
MTDIVTHFLFTSAGVIGIASVCLAALAALPWTLAEQASTERGLAYGGERLLVALAGVWGVWRIAPSPAVAGT